MRTPRAAARASRAASSRQAEPEAADRGGDPHPLDLGRRVVVELERAAPDRLAVQGGDQQEAGGQREFLVVGGDAAGDVESAVEPVRQLGEVGPQAEPGVRMPGIAGADLHRRGHQQPLDLGHRRDEPGALPRAQRAEDGRGQVVGAPVQHRALGQPAAGQARGADPPVGPALFHRDEPVVLQRAQQPAQVARVQVEPRPQQPDVAALGADLPQQPGLPERAVAGQVRIVERSDPLRHGPVEPAYLTDHVRMHSLTLVREIRRVYLRPLQEPPTSGLIVARRPGEH